MSGTKNRIYTCSSPIRGLGVCADAQFMAGEKVGYFEGYQIDHASKYTLYLDGHNIEPTGSLKHLNHSCSPNAMFSGKWLVALSDIKEGEEITIDYESTEAEISHPFYCKCGSDNCRGVIGKINTANKALQPTPKSGAAEL